jgi:ArsR family transcriptional regulator, arsenate/arsenite/antimonite-responsive transcriptional repressor
MKKILKFFKTLSDPTRLRIILLLLGKDLCVCELTFILKMSQSRVSHQLRILRDAGLVEDKRDGKWMIYGIPPGIRDTLRPLLDLFGKEERMGSAELLKDLKYLQICLKDDIRRTRGRRTRGPKETRGRRPA